MINGVGKMLTKACTSRWSRDVGRNPTTEANLRREGVSRRSSGGDNPAQWFQDACVGMYAPALLWLEDGCLDRKWRIQEGVGKVVEKRKVGVVEEGLRGKCGGSDDISYSM